MAQKPQLNIFSHSRCFALMGSQSSRTQGAKTNWASKVLARITKLEVTCSIIPTVRTGEYITAVCTNVGITR